VKYTWIRDHQKAFPIQPMCRVLGVSDSGYYAWLERKPSPQQPQQDSLAQAIMRSFIGSERRNGYRKVWEDLDAWSIDCCEETVRRRMKQMGIRAQLARRFVITTDSNHGYAVADNILNRDFTADAPNQKWVADITYIPTEEGWLYLAAVLDLFSRKIVGWATSDRINEALVTEALRRAIAIRNPPPGLLHHSDRGSQYAADGYQKILEDMEMQCSMSRKGNCWDNAVMERFFGSLKVEEVYRQIYKTRAQAEKALLLYIEWFYNTGRRHAALGYLTPAEVETRYQKESKVA
jgi:transposase InsO family protein